MGMENWSKLRSILESKSYASALVNSFHQCWQVFLIVSLCNDVKLMCLCCWKLDTRRIYGVEEETVQSVASFFLPFSAACNACK